MNQKEARQLRKQQAEILAFGEDIKNLSAKDAMIKPVIVDANDDAEEILEKLRKEDITVCVVVDNEKKFLVIDYDPEVIARLSQDGYDCRYGDANDSELLEELHFSRARMIISTIPSIDTNLLLITKIREENKLDIRKFLQERKAHLEQLKHRKQLEQERPRHENS